jgi:hypothetical protein
VLRDPAQRARYDRERRPTPPRRREQHRTEPAPAATVVIGTVNETNPAWIAPVDTTPRTMNRLAPNELLQRLPHDLFDPPG